MFFYEFLFHGEIINMFEEIEPYLSAKYLKYFPLFLEFAVFMQLDAKKKENIRETFQAMVPVVHCFY